MNVAENADRWLMPQVVDLEAVIGVVCRENECLSLKHPPALGGQLDPDNIETCHIAVHFSISGQIHQQIKDLPAGTYDHKGRDQTVQRRR